MTGSTTLPDYERPPVIEVALSVEFAPLPKMSTAYAGLFWQQIRDAYPQTEDHPPLQSAIENEQPSFGRPEVQFELMDRPPVPRIWFLTSTGNQLYQVQPDRFTHNWRRVAEKDVYPRYESVKRAFEDGLRRFMRFVEDQGWGALRLKQCEVTYVNHIHAGEGWQGHGDVDRVMKVWRSGIETAFLPRPEDVRFAARYGIKDAADKFRGRLSVQLQPAFVRSQAWPSRRL